MAHYAFLDENNIVTEVIVGREEDDLVDGITSWEDHYSEIRNQVCKRTSYNTVSGTHLLGGTPFRKNYAGLGYYYDESRDAFIPPKPFPSWLLNEETCTWEPPVPEPQDEFEYYWNEENQGWIKVDI